MLHVIKKKHKRTGRSNTGPNLFSKVKHIALKTKTKNNYKKMRHDQFIM